MTQLIHIWLWRTVFIPSNLPSDICSFSYFSSSLSEDIISEWPPQKLSPVAEAASIVVAGLSAVKGDRIIYTSFSVPYLDNLKQKCTIIVPFLLLSAFSYRHSQSICTKPPLSVDVI